MYHCDAMSWMCAEKRTSAHRAPLMTIYWIISGYRKIAHQCPHYIYKSRSFTLSLYLSFYVSISVPLSHARSVIFVLNHSAVNKILTITNRCLSNQNIEPSPFDETIHMKLNPDQLFSSKTQTITITINNDLKQQLTIDVQFGINKHGRSVIFYCLII